MKKIFFLNVQVVGDGALNSQFKYVHWFHINEIYGIKTITVVHFTFAKNCVDVTYFIHVEPTNLSKLTATLFFSHCTLLEIKVPVSDVLEK